MPPIDPNQPTTPFTPKIPAATDEVPKDVKEDGAADPVLQRTRPPGTQALS